MSKQFIEITDLPQDRNRVLHKVRPLLIRAFNKARSNPSNLALLKATCKYIYDRCAAVEKTNKALAKKTEKVATQTHASEVDAKEVAKEATVAE